MDNRNSHTRQQLLRAAETLMARHGVAGVRTRDILDLAGQRNQSALHYHFGSKEGLIRCMLADQMKRLDQRRSELMAKIGTGDARDILRAALLPMAEDVLKNEPGRDQLSLLTQFVHCPSTYAQAPDCAYDELIRVSRLPGICDIRNGIWESMPPLAYEIRTLRYRTAFSSAFTAILLWSEGSATLSPEQFTEELIGAIYPMLCSDPGADGSAYWPKNSVLFETQPAGRAPTLPSSSPDGKHDS